MKLKNKLVVFSLILASLLFVSAVSAHVVLLPTESVPGFQIYQIRVPNERDNPTVKLKLIVPAGVEIFGVLPTAGWNYSEVTVPIVNSNQTGPDGMPLDVPNANVTEIDWYGGQISPSDFGLFQILTQYNGNPTTLVWHAYQTYQSGEIVPWDDSGSDNPAPKVAILNQTRIDSLTNGYNNLVSLLNQQGSSINQLSQQPNSSLSSSVATYLAVGALLVSVLALLITLNSRFKHNKRHES